MKGKLIVIEGLDGSGKATQAAALAAALQAQGKQVRRITYPNYASPSSTLVKMYLAGDFGARPGAVNAFAAASFFAVDRFADYRLNWQGFYKAGGIVLADRYTTSNAVHQCSKLPKAEWDAYLDWLFDFEYNKMGIPAPDTVLYLRVDPAVSQRLLAERYRGDLSQKDIHERDTAYLAASRLAAEYCAARYAWLTVDCAGGQGLRSPESITREALAKLGFSQEQQETL